MEIFAEGLAFPEGPVVMEDGSVIVVEIAAGRITRCWNARKEVICEIGGGPNGAAIGPDGALWVCNNGGMDAKTMASLSGPENIGRIERVDLATGTFERVFDSCEGIPLESPNDLVIDANGRIWFSDFGKAHSGMRTASGLFCCESDGSAICAVNRQAVSYNGVGLSPDGTTIYVADTLQARLYRYANIAEAQRPTWVATAPGYVALDSMAVTESGNICVGTIRNGGITTFTPAGQTRFQPFDDRFVTNIAFGGDDMQDAFLTLSTKGMLIMTRWDEPGLKPHWSA